MLGVFRKSPARVGLGGVRLGYREKKKQRKEKKKKRRRKEEEKKTGSRKIWRRGG